MNEEIKQLVRKLGKGLVGPVAYDTAVVSLIPYSEDLTKPAFPEALQWIRDHQLSDGSWGTDTPVYAHGNTLSTLAAIIALNKWGEDQDRDRITRGEESLILLADIIPSETHESIGFELILPSLLRKASEYGLKVPIDRYVYLTKYKKKLQQINAYQKKYGFKKKHTFWFSLEMIEGLVTDHQEMVFEFDEIMLDANGSITASPSATAFFLTKMIVEKGIHVKKAYNYIEDLIRLHNGGIPAISPSDTFELSFSLAALLMGGIEPTDEILRPAIDRLFAKWIEFGGMMGCSSYLPPDSDAIAMFLYVLYSSKRLTQFDSVNTLLSFFNGSYLDCFKNERNHSISVNINGLIALRLFDYSPDIKIITSKIANWLEKQSSTDRFIFVDKWHISSYYCISRAVFALQGLNDELAQRCVDQMLRNQNSDGGWGVGQKSTLEETALVSLALCHWFRSDPKEINDMNLQTLESIDHFFKTFSGKTDVELWIAKVLYCPTTVVSAFIIAAKYSLSNTLDYFKTFEE